MILFIRHYQKPITGAHYRYDRLATYADSLEKNIFISPCASCSQNENSLVLWSNLKFIPRAPRTPPKPCPAAAGHPWT